MKITRKQLRRTIKEAQFGRFTGGAAPLDVPMRDSGPVPNDQLRKLADIFINDMGMSPEEVLSKPEFVERGITDLRQIEEGKMKITRTQLRSIIAEEHQRLLKESLTKEESVRTAVEQASYDITQAIEEIILSSIGDLEDDANYKRYNERMAATTRLASKIQKFAYNAIMDFEEQLRRGQ